MLTLEQRIEVLERQIKQMQPKNEKWVSASVISDKTGWDKKDFEKARRNGSISYKIIGKNDKGNVYRYLLSSIPEHLYKN